MAVSKADQERNNYAWLYGAQARKDGKERQVPEFWQPTPTPGCKASTDFRWPGRRQMPANANRREAYIAEMKPTVEACQAFVKEFGK